MTAVVSPRELVPRMRELRAEGHSASAIGRVLGIPESTVRNWWNAGTCIDCGAATDHSNGRVSVRCSSCDRAAAVERGLAQQHWTRERVIAAICWWVEEYGEPPATNDWQPNRAINELGDLERTRRGERLIAERRIPWVDTVIQRFGTWNAAIAAAGFTPRLPHGGGGNQLRRRNTRKPSAETLEAASPTEGMRP